MCLILVVLALVLLAGCTERPLAQGCSNPQFMGSEGITHNDDLEEAFVHSRPLLDGAYRYYEDRRGNVLWKCTEEESIEYPCWNTARDEQ